MVVRPSLRVSLWGITIVRKAMSRLGCTFSEIAERAYVSRSTLQRFTSGAPISAETFYSICQLLKLNPEDIIDKSKEEEENNDVLRVERSIEFPSEYWEAGTSILSYFSRILRVKYPSQKIKVRIEQEGLRLRMIIDTPTGEKEEIEKTLEEYGLVVTGKIQPESFLSDPFEAMALKNKLEIADLELRQAKKLLDFTRHNSQQRIESLEVQVNKLHSIIENGLQSGNHVFGVIRKMAEQDKSRYDLSSAKFGGGFAAEGGFQVGGNLIDLSSASNLTDAAQQIQELLQQLEEQNVSVENATQQAASDLAKQAEANPTIMGKLVKWGQSLADTAGKTTVSEAAKGVVKLALQMSGIPLP
jgi:transcriptional regulator with XRE-family HTH domain